MSIKDINIGKKEFDEKTQPWKTSWYFEVIGTFLKIYYTTRFKCKVNKEEIKDLKSPYLLLQNHASFSDFILTWKGVAPNKTTWVVSVEEFLHREWVMRSIGCFPKRKFTPSISVVKNISYAFRNLKEVCTIFPEARFSIAGINENIDAASYARLIKVFKVPVVVALAKGNFVSSPQWCKHPTRHIPISCDFKLILTEEEVSKLSVEEIQKRLEDNFIYDDYKYWQESGRKIKCKKKSTRDTSSII